MPDAPFIPDELRQLVADPTNGERFTDLWPYLCSEGTAWPAAYAAVPHLVTIARGLPAAASERDDYLYVVGLVAICSGELGEAPAGIPDDIADAYRQALPEALTLLAETLATGEHDQISTRYLLAAVSALKGHLEFAEILNELDVYAECQSCGEPMLELPE
ncbi:hypothetical protein GCM10017557_03360 [Streptomyces aurantiacus]|uniref:Uncharacterized protein n=1 Tax=Streptomyces aurantiacus TaxID=47760 RepID=A0A7G1NV52_9ACTN|nr:hypothetical protein GCM10017557_03360 [Streptomyces aurantiacus]